MECQFEQHFERDNGPNYTKYDSDYTKYDSLENSVSITFLSRVITIFMC